MTNITDLPPEVVIKIFLYLPLKDCLRFSRVCKDFSEIGNTDLVWEKRIAQDFRVTIKKKDEGLTESFDSEPEITSKLFYRHVLFKYGKLLGLWQNVTNGHYGGLFQVISRTHLSAIRHHASQSFRARFFAIFCLKASKHLIKFQ